MAWTWRYGETMHDRISQATPRVHARLACRAGRAMRPQPRNSCRAQCSQSLVPPGTSATPRLERVNVLASTEPPDTGPCRLAVPPTGPSCLLGLLAEMLGHLVVQMEDGNLAVFLQPLRHWLRLLEQLIQDFLRHLLLCGRDDEAEQSLELRAAAVRVLHAMRGVFIVLAAEDLSARDECRWSPKELSETAGRMSRGDGGTGHKE